MGGLFMKISINVFVLKANTRTFFTAHLAGSGFGYALQRCKIRHAASLPHLAEPFQRGCSAEWHASCSPLSSFGRAEPPSCFGIRVRHGIVTGGRHQLCFETFVAHLESWIFHPDFLVTNCKLRSSLHCKKSNFYSSCQACKRINIKQYLPPWSPQHPTRLDQHLHECKFHSDLVCRKLASAGPLTG